MRNNEDPPTSAESLQCISVKRMLFSPDSLDLHSVLEPLEQFIVTDVPILIDGPTGAGKDYLARAIHNDSDRAPLRFVNINCDEFPVEMLESHLFGHVKGAFTGALTNFSGLIRLADRGTLFVNEIGDMRLETQKKLLRVLEDRVVRPLGTIETYAVDFRLISASQHDLHDRIKKGLFREDLYYRIAGYTVSIPPLRERKRDLPVLASKFLSVEYAKFGKPQKMFTPEAISFILDYAWPGNLRELKTVISRIVILSNTVEQIESGLVARALSLSNPLSRSIYDQLGSEERQKLLGALSAAGSRRKAATMLGMTERHFITRLRHHGINARESYRSKSNEN